MPGAHKLYFVGTADGFERPMVDAAGLPFAAYDQVQAGPIHGVGPLRALISLFKLLLGVVQSLLLLRRHRPAVILLTGGWANVPLAAAAWLLRLPVLVYLPDIEPGLTIRVLKHFARQVAITVPEAAVHFRPGQTVVTGYPLRQTLLEAEREKALGHFGLEAGHPTLLVFGGSRGARSINRAVAAVLPELLALGLQIIHVTGELDWPQFEQMVGEQPAYHAFPYLHDDMGLALAAADLVICRAGASTLGELPLFGLASILVPYPHAWRYQKTNADYLASRGAAVRMDDEKMSEELLPTIRALLDDSGRLAAMQQQARALARPDGADNVAQALVKLAEGSTW